MSEPRLLQLLQDSELTKVLAKFFEDQAQSARISAVEFMSHDIPKTELARKYACYAAAYEEAMPRLKEYAKQV